MVPQKSRLSESHLLRMRTAIVLGGIIVSVIVNSALPAKEMLASIISLIVVACAALEACITTGSNGRITALRSNS
ncbi:hypothetical protein [Nitrosomonas ureae]|uniref:hypothetical protein n=1 Tax=Nitrosomonas ureae TaxID=44577 RepID=UPI0015E8E995|nr:hypothetical protein [Nitrosomonas ureae]